MSFRMRIVLGDQQTPVLSKFFYRVLKMQSHGNTALHFKNVNTTAEENQDLIQI